MAAPGKIFQSEGREADVTRAITRAWAEQFDQMVQSEVLVVGAGPSGLTCAWRLAQSGVKVVVVEQANHLGGGFWHGGYMANKAAIRRPADRILEELRVPGQDVGQGIVLCDPPHTTAALIAAAYSSGAKFLNLTVVRDVIWRENRLEGLVINWAPLYAMPHGTAHVDPIPLESYVVVDATGHDASVVSILAKRNLCPKPPGNGAMWIEESEEEVVKRTGEYLPGLWIAGLSVAAVHGTPRMGPAFGAMLLSGERAAEQIVAKLRRPTQQKQATASLPAVAPPAPSTGTQKGLVSVNLPSAPTPVAPTRSFGPGIPPAATPAAPSTTRGFAPGTAASLSQTPPGGLPAVNPAGPPSTKPPSGVQKAAEGHGIPTVNPETGRWTRGSTSRFFKKKPPEKS